VKASASPEFEQPPINEIVIGVSFQRPPRLTLAQLGRFWGNIQKDFPATEDHSPIGDLAGATLADGLPLPRLWLVEASGNKLLQLQVDRFYLNWRRQRDGDEYPRFHALLKLFDTYWNAFRAFVGEFEEAPLVLAGAELAKISHFPEGVGWGNAADLGSVLTFVVPPDLKGGDLQNLAFRCAINFDGSAVTADLKMGRLREPDKGVTILEMRASPTGVKGVNATDARLGEKFTSANQLLNFAFTSLTTDRMQTEWGRKK
jgi:hypothetical protein